MKFNFNFFGNLLTLWEMLWVKTMRNRGENVLSNSLRVKNAKWHGKDAKELQVMQNNIKMMQESSRRCTKDAKGFKIYERTKKNQQSPKICKKKQMW